VPWLPTLVFHGSAEESVALKLAVAHNCACQLGQQCGAHSAMLSQRFLDGIVFARFIRARLLKEEGLTCTSRQSVRTR
jgi:hypothetical protein